MKPLTLATPVSTNKKLAGRRPIATTQRDSSTCAADCVFMRDDGDGVVRPRCYASSGPGGGVFALVNRSGSDSTVRELRKIKDLAPQCAVVRHLVSGDVDPEYMTMANSIHADRPDLDGYGYTHKWREGWLSPAFATGWTLNASCETQEDVEKALADGWQAVIESPVGDSLAGQRIAGRRVVPCPAQEDDRVKCSDCRLCRMNTESRPIVEFTLHGGNMKANLAAVAAKREE